MVARQINSLLSRKIIIAIALLLASGVALFGWFQFNASATEINTLDDATLEAKSLAIAHNLGLKGAPISKKGQRMTLETAAGLVGSSLGKDAGKFGLTPNRPVFVYALKGKVEPTGPIEYPPDVAPPKYDRILLVINAQNGSMVLWGYYLVGAQMPVQLP